MSKIKKLLVIAGSAKTGTSSLANWLNQSDDMVLGLDKECRYFSGFEKQTWSGPSSETFLQSMITEATAFDANFPELRQDQWAIDGSTDYIWADGVEKRLQGFAQNCELKVICIVRNPVERAVSEYNHTLRQGWENLSFADSIASEQERRTNGWHPLFYHKRRSEIRDDIHRFHEAFGQNLLILGFDEMKQPQLILDKIARFLDIDLSFIDTSQAYNVSYLNKNRFTAFLKKSKKLVAIGRVILPSAVKSRLWDSLHVNARQKTTVSDAEKRDYLSLLSSEISACEESDLIPTDRW